MSQATVATGSICNPTDPKNPLHSDQSCGKTAPIVGQVLIVEDDLRQARTLVRALTNEGHAAEVATSCGEASAILSARTFDVLLLDWTLPDGNGLELLSGARARGIETHAIMITGRDGTDDKLLAFALGADDYLVKPFDARELLARIQRTLRKSARPTECGPIQISFERYSVTVGAAKVIQGNSLEFRLLARLAQSMNRVVPRTVLEGFLWPQDAPADASHAVDVHIASLRKKLGAAGSFIETVRGEGFRLRSGRASESDM